MNIRADHWNYNWIEQEKVSFVFSDKFNGPVIKWAGFDDARRFEHKVRFLKQAGLGGAMLFTLDNDDHCNDCAQGRFPLLSVINRHLNKNVRVEYPDHTRIFDKFKTQFNFISIMEHNMQEFFHASNVRNQNGKF